MNYDPEIRHLLKQQLDTHVSTRDPLFTRKVLNRLPPRRPYRLRHAAVLAAVFTALAACAAIAVTVAGGMTIFVPGVPLYHTVLAIMAATITATATICISLSGES